MAGWLALMLVMAVAGRETTRDLNVFEIMEVRSILGFFLLLPLIHLNGGFAMLRTSRLQLHVARNLIHYVAQLGWFFALTLIPLGQVVAIEFTMPIWTALLAASFIGERITGGKIEAIVLGLIGVLVIVRPATGEINPGQLLALGATVGFGISITVMKFLTRTENTLTIIFWMLVVPGDGRFHSHALCLGLAVSLSLGLDIGDRDLRYLLPLLHGPRDALCGRDDRGADGLPPRSLDRDRGLGALRRKA
jgi:drug/metabolite transporter (DMT)-like permease